jgi:hypothetical protein
MERHVLLQRLVELDNKLFPKEKKTTDFALPGMAPLPTTVRSVLGGVIGANVGRIASRRKWNPQTNRWEDDQGNETSAPVGAALTGAAAGVGAPYAHRAVMRNYGGAGGVKQAYGNLGRNVGRAGSEALDMLKKRLASLRKLVPRFSAGEIDRLVELSEKLKAETLKSGKPATEFAKAPIGPDHSGRNRFAGGVLAGLATAGAARTISRAGGLAGIARKMKAARAGMRTGSYIYRTMA